MRVRKSHTRNIHTFNSFLLFSDDLEMTDLPGDEEGHPNLIYQCHESISESSDVINSKVGHAPPTPIMITRNKILEPESKDFDELGFLSNYILEMEAQQERVQEDAQKQAQEVLSNDLSSKTSQPLRICGLSVPDFSPDPPPPEANGKKCSSATKKSVHFHKSCGGSIPPSTTSKYKSEAHPCRRLAAYKVHRRVQSTSERRGAQDKKERIYEAKKDPHDAICDKHRGRQHLDFLVGATREKRSRSISPSRLSKGKMLEKLAPSKSTDSIRDNSGSQRSRRKNQRKSDSSTSAQKQPRSKHNLKLKTSMFNRPLCELTCQRCGAEITTLFGKEYCTSCNPNVFKAVERLKSDKTFQRSSRKSQRTKHLIREIDAIVDSGSNCDLVNDEFYLHDAEVQTIPIGGVAGTGISKKKGKVRAWVKGKKNGIKTKTRMSFEGVNHLGKSHLPIFAVSKLTDKNNVVHFEKHNDHIILADGTRVEMTEKQGLYYIRMEQILSQDEMSCLIAMSPPHCRPEILENGMAMAADINLWHNRLHISPKRIKAIYDLGAVEGLSFNNLPEHGKKCTCETCKIARAARKSVPKVRHYDMAADKPFHTVATDVKVVNTTSLSGFNYSMHFVDEFSRYSHMYFMQSKDKKESRRVLEEFLSDVRRLGWRVGRIRSDLGSEYVNNTSTSKRSDKSKFELMQSEFEKICLREDITFTQAPKDGSKINGIVERFHRTVGEMANAFLYHGRMSPIFWEYAYRHSNWIHNRLVHSGLVTHSPYEIVFAKRPRFDRLRTLFCDMFEWQASNKTPGVNKGRKLIYLGESSSCDVGYLGYDPESRTVKTVYNVVFDEDSNLRRNNLRTYDAHRKKKNIDKDVVEELVFDDSDAKYHSDAVRKLFSEVPDENKVVPVGDVTDSTPELKTTGGGLVSDCEPESSTTPKTGTTNHRSHMPVNHSDESASQNEAHLDSRGQISKDETISDSDNMLTSLPPDSQDSLTSENLKISNETNESNPHCNFDDGKAKAGSHQTDLNYEDIVYDRHDGKYTKKFDAEDDEVRFRKETEESGEVTVRPLRLTPIGREQDPTPADKKFQKYIKERNIILHFLQDCPKEQFTTVKKKKVLSKSYVRYQNYKLATSYEEFLALSISGKPQGQSTKKARSIAQADFRHDYNRGYIIFPGNESCLPGHIYDSRQLAKDFGLPNQSDLLVDTAKVYNAVEEALIEGEDFDSDLFEKALLHAYTVDDSILYLDNRKTLMAYAEKVSRNYLMQDPVTKKFHETPKSIKIASTGEDKDIWIPSMERELGAMKRKEVWDEVSELPIGTIPLPCMFIYKIKSDMLGFISEYKSRLVCCGNLAKEGVHYQSDELSSSVFTYDSLRTLVSCATANNWALQQLDISNAYLNADLKETVYLRHPLKKTTPDGKPIFLALKKSLYGLPQSGYNWAQQLHRHLKSGGFKQSTADTCMFRLKTTRGKIDPDCPRKDRNIVEEMHVGSYVDDLCYSGSSDFIMKWFMKFISDKFDVKKSETGPLEWILGGRVTRDISKGTTSIDQSVAIEKLAKKLGLHHSNPIKTPMSATPLLIPNRSERPPSEDFNYLSVIGSLLHIVNYTRPDCAYAVGSLARFSSNYDNSHLKAVKRVVSYLYHTRDHAITYYKECDAMPNEPIAWEAGSHPLDWKRNSTERLKIFTDSSFGDDVLTKRSTSGEIIFLNGGPISWFSRLQKLVALSTAESEIYAAIDGVKIIAHLKILLNELGARDMTPVTTYQDNQACIQMGSQLRNHKNARHYVTRLSYLQQQVVNGTIKFKEIGTKDQISDIMTKPLPDEAFVKLSRTLVQKLSDLYPDLRRTNDTT